MDTNFKMLAVDMDGTLLNSESRISERNLGALKAAVDAGTEVVFATGRRWLAALPVLDEAGINAPVVLHSGALIRDYPGQEILFHRHIPTDLAQWAIRIINKHDRDPIVYDNALRSNGIFVQKPPRYQGAISFLERNKDILKIDPKLAGEEIDFEPIQISLRGELDDLRELIDELAAAKKLHVMFATFPGITGWMADLHHIEASKADALNWLCNLHGIKPDQVIAMGDNVNDTEMLQFAGFGLAMENGTIEAKQAADEIAPGNDDDGVAWAIENFILGHKGKDALRV